MIPPHPPFRGDEKLYKAQRDYPNIPKQVPNYRPQNARHTLTPKEKQEKQEKTTKLSCQLYLTPQNFPTF